jgi:hypothetical protein
MKEYGVKDSWTKQFVIEKACKTVLCFDLLLAFPLAGSASFDFVFRPISNFEFVVFLSFS